LIPIKRYGSVIRLRPEKFDEYKKLHFAAWPEILAKITECGIRNCSIYHKDGFLFSYFEYVGSDFKADMALMAAGSTHAGMVDPLQALPGTAGNPPARRVVGLDGGNVPLGLKGDARRLGSGVGEVKNNRSRIS
jgi:L-rhamnose mutarotase